MEYHIDAEKVSLDDLRTRIDETDLVPSRVSLLEGIGVNFKALEKQGITTLAGLRKELKNAKRLEALSKKTRISTQYLTLLRREIEGYFPKPPALKAFEWLPQEEIARLEGQGIRDAAALCKAAGSTAGRAELVKTAGVDPAVLETLARLADLTRVQWVSPTTARMLLETGCDSVSRLAAADAETLCNALERVNEGSRFFKGKIGLRDIKRLVRAAGYVQE
jgi:hypothetical protein